jgi:DNA invertase Pin-like site-specific DNA recombinase
VNHQLYAFLALDLARQRAEEANRYHLASLFVEDRESTSSGLRRSLARALAAISRGSASAVRRLDSCIADDLGRTLAPTE